MRQVTNSATRAGRSTPVIPPPYGTATDALRTRPDLGGEPAHHLAGPPFFVRQEAPALLADLIGRLPPLLGGVAGDGQPAIDHGVRDLGMELQAPGRIPVPERLVGDVF